MERCASRGPSGALSHTRRAPGWRHATQTTLTIEKAPVVALRISGMPMMVAVVAPGPGATTWCCVLHLWLGLAAAASWPSTRGLCCDISTNSRGVAGRDARFRSWQMPPRYLGLALLHFGRGRCRFCSTASPASASLASCGIRCTRSFAAASSLANALLPCYRCSSLPTASAASERSPWRRRRLPVAVAPPRAPPRLHRTPLPGPTSRR
mmetsp:Transcript_41527/g.130002  ORF Transcript_41527/g.130002 Transcript_41527/m.130002 type:complete len:209 (+) Transcript_41527:311-937(+)